MSWFWYSHQPDPDPEVEFPEVEWAQCVRFCWIPMLLLFSESFLNITGIKDIQWRFCHTTPWVRCFSKQTQPFQDQQYSCGVLVLHVLCSGSLSLSWNTLFLVPCQVGSNECPYMLLFPLPSPSAVEISMIQKQFGTFFKKLSSPCKTTQSNSLYM